MFIPCPKLLEPSLFHHPLRNPQMCHFIYFSQNMARELTFWSVHLVVFLLLNSSKASPCAMQTIFCQFLEILHSSLLPFLSLFFSLISNYPIRTARLNDTNLWYFYKIVVTVSAQCPFHPLRSIFLRLNTGFSIQHQITSFRVPNFTENSQLKSIDLVRSLNEVDSSHTKFHI